MTIPSTLGCSAWWLPFRQGLNFFWCFTMARLYLSKRYPTRNTYLVLDLFSLKCSILKSTVIVCLFNPQFYNILQYGLNLCFWGLNPYPRDLLRHVSQILVPFALVNRTIFLVNAKSSLQNTAYSNPKNTQWETWKYSLGPRISICHQGTFGQHRRHIAWASQAPPHSAPFGRG